MPLLALVPSSLRAITAAGLGVRRSFGCFVLRVKESLTIMKRQSKGGGSVERYLAVGQKALASGGN